MDRFEWVDFSLQPEESNVISQTGVALYDGPAKSRVLAVPLSLVVLTEEQPSGFAKSAKIAVHFQKANSGKAPGPVASSQHDYIRLSFRNSGEVEFYRFFMEQLRERRWEKIVPPADPVSGVGARNRPGIMGIERSIQHKQRNMDMNISQSFKDLRMLMEKAKEMVQLSKTISTKIREKQGDITEDETVKFKSYLLSMGIADPVTRETHGSGDKYFTELARQLAAVLEKPLQECGGIMTLSDVYCRVNRARGMELLSPEDLLNACEMFEFLKLPVRLKTFDSGVMVLQLLSHSEEEVVKQTQILLEDKESLTAEELAQQLGLSVILAKERLLLTEKMSKACRDETVEGLRFYPNYFVTK
ncbi:hypothetical protein CHS0354_012636 [Potamilus streckersoni]|uniref:Vacuolar protein-sorting-associated protein 36 n=1 Tax=Potamilus streckersoni TaxID=2493646 RepID=A0AAE0W2T2_9BIVA|nr:hypothetical protein CHS0354_012636 [Potamilus streckersoni]